MACTKNLPCLEVMASQSKSLPSSRADLMRMSKKELSKLCKKIKVASTGTKTEMINRIAPRLATILPLSREERDKWFTSLTEVNKYGFQKRVDLIITGFLKDIDQEHQLPIDLMIVLVSYIGGMSEIVFDIECRMIPREDIKDEGTLIHRKVNKFAIHKRNGIEKDVSAFIIYACSKGFDSGCHEWHIRFRCKLDNKIPKDSIGIVTDIDDVEKCNNDKGLNEFRSKGDYYWIDNKQKQIKYKANGLEVKLQWEDYMLSWEKNDIITVRLDCDAWNVEFRINNKMIAKIQDIKPQIYYFAIGSRTNNVKYEVVC